MKILGLMLAGAFGALARYGMTLAIQGWLAARNESSFPLATLIINVVGSLLLAFLVTLVAREALKPEWQLILGTGFLGAFTTFSAFELESEKLLSSGNWPAAMVYIFGNLLLGFGAIFLGRALALKIA
jgi:CrcB protein